MFTLTLTLRLILKNDFAFISIYLTEIPRATSPVVEPNPPNGGKRKYTMNIAMSCRIQPMANAV
jgi:hypothetical protein